MNTHTHTRACHITIMSAVWDLIFCQVYICFLRFLHEVIITSYFLHLSFLFFPHLFFPLFVVFFLSFYFVWTCDPAAAKLQLVASEGGASSHNRLQRCMRRARSLQQRMQLQQEQQQQQKQDSEAGRQQPQQPEQPEEERQQLQERPRYHL